MDDIRVQLRGGRCWVQAKRSLSLGSKQFRDAIAQWVAAARTMGLDPQRDRLALAVDDASKGVVALGTALQRRRRTEPGRATVAEVDALASLVAVLQGLGVTDPVETDTILNLGVVAHIRVSNPDSPERVTAEALLDERVVTNGGGVAAFADLKSAARDSAVGRFGRVLREWLEVLVAAGRTLRESAEGSPSARAVRASRRITAYRHQFSKAGSEIDLRPLGIAIPPVSVAGLADSWEVSDPVGGRRATSRDLGHAIQRRGRMLLLGLPGAGKSSALSQLAGAWAADDEQPVPVVVPLQQFLSSPPPQSLRELVGAGRFVPRDDPEVVDALVDRLVSGEGALFLDGLDEARHRRFELIVAIHKIVDGVDEATDVVLATRDIAYADAATLGWPAMRLEAPSDLDDIFLALGTSFLERLSVPAADRHRWIRDRVETTEDLRRQHPVLRETPLLSVLAFVLLCQTATSPKSLSRARILSDLLDEQTSRKELVARAYVERWPRNSSDEVKELVRDSLAFIGHQLYDRQSMDRDDLKSALSGRIQLQWGSPPAVALSASDALLHLWDETGVFVGEGRPVVVSARLRALVEVAEARYAATLGSGIGAWIEQRAPDDDSRETVLLATGLSGELADGLASWACQKGTEHAVLLTAEAMERGAIVEGSPSICLLDHLVELVRTAPTVGAAKALARYPSPLGRRSDILEILRSVPDAEARATAVALAVVRWDIPTTDVTGELRTVLTTPSPGKMFVDDGWEESVVSAADRLLSARLPCDDEIVAAYESGSSNTSRRLDDVLARHGRSDLRRRVEDGMGRDHVAAWERLGAGRDAAWAAVLEHLSKPAPAVLTRAQSRRLQELADLDETLAPGDMSMRDTIDAERKPGVMVRALDLVVALGGFDRAVLSAQAKLISSVRPLQAQVFLGDFAHGRELHCWPSDRITETKAECLDLMGSGPMFAYLAASALLHAPGPADTVLRVAGITDRLDPKSRGYAVGLCLALDRSTADALIASEDPVARRRSGEWIGREWAAGNIGEASLRSALMSTDGGVRSEAIEAIVAGRGSVDPALLAEMDSEPAASWECEDCATLNTVSDKSCTKCRRVGLRDVGPDSELRRRLSQA